VGDMTVNQNLSLKNSMSDSESKDPNLKEKTTQIFISYSWKDGQVADTICNMFKDLRMHGMEIHRDKECLTFMQNIKDFMKSIKKKDYVIILISDSYLKSYNCMYEISELVKVDDYKSKVMVLIDKNVDIYNAKGINKYILFWQEKCKELEKELNELEYYNQSVTIDELRKSKEINLKISDFLQEIKYLNFSPYDENITIENFNKIIEFIK
jgi:hypothetical protein